MMSLGTFDLGDSVRVSGEFRASNVLVDPTVVNFKFTNPAGTTTTYVYLTDAQLVKDAAGQYHVDINANARGRWAVRYYSTGTYQGADEQYFDIEQGTFS